MSVNHPDIAYTSDNRQGEHHESFDRRTLPSRGRPPLDQCRSRSGHGIHEHRHSTAGPFWYTN